MPSAVEPTAATVLAVETAGSCCSAALTRGGVVLAAERRPLRHGHAEVLLPMIERITTAAGLPRSQIDTVAAAVGPGGFTGIRVGLAAARGIALALGARLVGITGFAAVAAVLAAGDSAANCPHALIALDSRRADLYVQLFALDPAALAAAGTAMAAAARPLAAAKAVLPECLADYLAGFATSTPLLIAGDAADAAAAALGRSPGVKIVDHSAPDALGVAAAALHQLRSGAAAHPVRPLYLRPPDVTLAKPRVTIPAATP